MNYPEELKEKYNEVMYDERGIIEKFLKDQYDIRYGRQRDTWHFEPAIEMVAHQGSHVLLHDIKLDKDKVVVFYVDAFGDKDAEWECFDFAYGELSKVIEALPDADDIVMKNAVNDLSEFSVNLRCDLILQENPFVTKINGKDVSIYEFQYEDGRVISYDKQGRIVNDEYESDFLVGLRDHINISVLHNSKEYKELMELLSLQENMRFECNEYGDATFVIDGTDMTFDVSCLHRDDKGNLVIYGGDIDADVCDGITLTEKEIKPQYLTSIIELMKPKYTDIMDTHNGHNAELVRKINEAWKSNKYHDMFEGILHALLERDYDEYCDKFETPDVTTSDYAMEHAYEIMEDVCDNRDLETILSFIRYEE
jgi:hypothetical protein